MDTRSELRFHRQIVIPVALSFLLLVVLFTAGFYGFERASDNRSAAASMQRVRNIWGNLRQESTVRLDWFVRETQRDPKLAAAMRQGDAKALLAATEPRYREIHERFGISHWYFITPERVVLLRVHNPADAGDKVERITLSEAADNDKTVTGLELGATATLTLRHVVPWHDHGELIGYVEMGTEVDWFDHQINQLLGVEVISAVNKSYTNARNFETGKRVLGFAGNWDDHADIAVLNQTTTALPPGLFSLWSHCGAPSSPAMIRDFLVSPSALEPCPWASCPLRIMPASSWHPWRYCVMSGRPSCRATNGWPKSSSAGCCSRHC